MEQQETSHRAADKETSHSATDQETGQRAADQETSHRAADQETSHCAADPPVMETSPCVNTMKYCIRYKGNGSKKWDGKWLRSLYYHSELVPGNKLSLPWMGKGGRMSYWSAVLVDPSQELSSDKSASAQKSQKGMYLHLAVLVGLQLVFVLNFCTGLGEGKGKKQQCAAPTKSTKRKKVCFNQVSSVYICMIVQVCQCAV